MTAQVTHAFVSTKPASNDASRIDGLKWNELHVLTGIPSLDGTGSPFTAISLAAGSVINWNSGDVTLTHAANLLTFAGASSGYSFDAPMMLPSGGSINFNSSDVVIGHGANLLAFSGASSGYTFDAPIVLPSGGAISFNNADVVITHSANSLAFTGGATGYSFDAPILLPSGGTINFNAGDVTIAHAANILSFIGASNGYTFDASIGIPSGGSISFNSGDVFITHATNALSFTGASNGYTFDAPIIGGSAAGSVLTLKATSGVGVGAEAINLVGGSNGAKTMEIIETDRIVWHIDGVARGSVGTLGANTWAWFPDGSNVRVAISDTSMQLHYDNIIKGVGDGSVHAPNATWKLPDWDASNAGNDHALCSLTAVENTSTYTYTMQYTVGHASGVRLSHLFLTENSAGSATPRLYITANVDEVGIGYGTVAPSADVQMALLHLHAISGGNGSHVHFTNADTGLAGSDGFYVGIDGSEQGRLWNKEATAILFGISNAEQARFLSTGQFIKGHTASIQLAGVDGAIQQIGTDGATSLMGLARFSADNSGNLIASGKSRNASKGSHTVVQSGDFLLGLLGYGSDGTGFIQAARINFAVDGTPGTNDMPGRIEFLTTLDGASSPTERLRIENSGRITQAVGTAIPAGGTTGLGYTFSSTANFGVFFGSGAPSLSAAKGSLYLRSDGTTTNNRAYINTDGATTWTAITTVA